MIAQNELLTAEARGKLIGWQAARDRWGAPWGKKWIVSTLENHGAACQDNAKAGPIPLDDAFPSGQDCNPAPRIAPAIWCRSSRRQPVPART